MSLLDLDRLDALLEANRGRIEYVVGSIHHVNEIPIDFDQPTYEKAVKSFSQEGDSAMRMRTLERFLCAYLDA